MARLPFNPKRAQGDDAKKASGKPARREKKQLGSITEANQLTVSQLSELIKSTLEQRITSPLRVIGEISNLKSPNHWYFSLKDANAVISAVAWASSAKKFSFTPKEGDEVIATGHVSHFPPQGRTQFYVTKLEPVGAGALELQFRALCEELRGQGYFDDARKKPLPVFPRRIAVVTSPTGAAVQDVINTAAHRCKAVGLLLVPVRVQGEGAKEEIARAIKRIDRDHAKLGVDAILVTRGGGSIEDLWAFNERIVAEAAFHCSIPLVAAIGHESDTTVIELVADLRASTPTQAAMRLVPDSADLHRQVEHLEHRLHALLKRRVERERERVNAITRHEAFRDPRVLLSRAGETVMRLARDLKRSVRGRLHAERAQIEHLAGRWSQLRPAAIVSERHERLAILRDRLDRAVRRRIDQRSRVDGLKRGLQIAITRHVRHERKRLNALERELAAVDPRLVLKRGYSYTTSTDGTLIRSIRDVTTGMAIRTNVRDGVIDSVVGGLTNRPKPKRRGSSRKAADDADQMDLFGE
ncbi:MAG: exodeoxyribonuclease VII large subunit [Phycisphaerales bacterium]|nr:MAG: exodeoxyribonuclease VII large subunit [Phycisphaerales bacterium]